MLTAELHREPAWTSQIDQNDPLLLFDRWLVEASRSESNDATAMTLATTTLDGRPSARIVLLKGRVEDEFLFYTDYNSRKGRELVDNPLAALLFHWPWACRQVRIEGEVHRLDPDRSDAYFASRERGSQLGAWASQQSVVLEDRVELIDAVDAASGRFEGAAIPRPSHWGGFTLQPALIEFWEAGAHRLHHRRLFSRHGDRWETMKLYP